MFRTPERSMWQALNYQNKKAAPEHCFKKLPRKRFRSTMFICILYNTPNADPPVGLIHWRKISHYHRNNLKYQDYHLQKRSLGRRITRIGVIRLDIIIERQLDYGPRTVHDSVHGYKSWSCLHHCGQAAPGLSVCRNLLPVSAWQRNAEGYGKWLFLLVQPWLQRLLRPFEPATRPCDAALAPPSEDSSIASLAEKPTASANLGVR